MSEQDEAMRLADVLDASGASTYGLEKSAAFSAASELRRLHADNERLRQERDALRDLLHDVRARYIASRIDLDAALAQIKEQP